MQRELIQLEKRVAQLQAELARMDNMLADPGLHERTRAADARLYGSERADVAMKLADAKARWVEVGTELESIHD